MFGMNKGKLKVTVHINKITVHINKDGGIWVIKPDGVSVSVRDLRDEDRFYPTAEEAREIEPNVDWDAVNNKVRSILRDVERNAVIGRSGKIGFVFNLLTLTPAEEKEILKNLKDLGYTVIRVGESYRITW